MSYKKSIWISRDKRFQIIDKYHSCRAMPKSPLIRERRQRQRGETPPSQEQINLRHRVDRQTRLLMDNFRVGDWWITYKLAKQVSFKVFKKAYDKMMRRLRDEYRKRGHDLKYIAVHENITGRGRLHGHVIIPNICVFSELKKLMRKAWELGDCHIKPYGGDAMDARRMASYMCKEDAIGKAIREKQKMMAEAKKAGQPADKRQLQKLDQEIRAGRSRLCPSTNLVRTKPVKKEIREAETYREEIKAPKGYHVVKELSYNGWTADGYPYQHVVYERDG